MRTNVSAPCERRAAASSRVAWWSARARRLVQVAGGQRCATESKVMSSLRSSFRSMLRLLGRLGDDREHLQRHAALEQARDVDVAARAAPQQVTVPQQRVRVQVRDQQARVELSARAPTSIGRDEDTVQPAFDGRRDDRSRGGSRARGAGGDQVARFHEHARRAARNAIEPRPDEAEPGPESPRRRTPNASSARDQATNRPEAARERRWDAAGRAGQADLEQGAAR